MATVLFISVFLIAACGLVYELIAGTLASYLLGDSVFQFSTVIGAYLFAMGIGSFFSRFIGRGLVAQFISIELLVGLVGGFSSSVLFLVFAYTQSFRLILYLVVIVVGVLVGLEIPLLMRILKDRYRFGDLGFRLARGQVMAEPAPEGQAARQGRAAGQPQRSVGGQAAQPRRRRRKRP